MIDVGSLFRMGVSLVGVILPLVRILERDDDFAAE